MEVQHNNATYVLDTEKAIQLGVLKKKKRKIHLSDIKNGSIFRWHDGIRTYHTYLMVDNRKDTSGQCIGLSEDDFYHTFFSDTEKFEILDVRAAKWITEID